MKVLSLWVVAGFAAGILAGCGPEMSSPDVAAGEKGPRYEATLNGKPVMVRDATDEPNLTSQQDLKAERTVSQAACWVTLEWCSEPGTGDIVCTQNGGCTTQQFIEACLSLARDICGI